MFGEMLYPNMKMVTVKAPPPSKNTKLKNIYVKMVFFLSTTWSIVLAGKTPY